MTASLKCGLRREPPRDQTSSGKAYAVWWTGLLMLHCINLGYYTGVATLYNSFKHTYIYVRIKSLSIGIDNSEYYKISAIHATIAAIHALFILLMVGSSIHARKLVFQPDLRPLIRAIAHNPRLVWICKLFPSSAPRASVASLTAVVTADSDRLSSARTHSRRFSETIINTGSLIFARDGLLGVDSVYFDHILLVRELVETTLQTYQVYRMSQLLPRLWLIRFYVSLLVINCWAVPILHRYYRDRETTRRMLCLMFDAVLDMVSSVGISLIIFGTYVPQYNDPNGFGFPFSNWFDDHWMANMQQEFQMMLVVSWGDMASRLVFALGLLQCMEAIKEMLTPVSSPPTIAALVVDGEKDFSKLVPLVTNLSGSVPPLTKEKANDAKLKNESDASKTNEDSVRRAGPMPPTQAAAPVKFRASHTRLKRFVELLVHVGGPGAFVLWGCAILAFHLIAETHHSESSCTLQLKPWLSDKPGCSIIEVNCHDIQSNGQDQLLMMALEKFDAARAARVVFRHCPALVMPPKLLEFRSMAGLKIYNSTVTSWDSTSALTGAHHPNMRSLFLVRVDLPNGEIPMALLSDDVPPLMAEFITSFTNLRALPDDLATKWPPRMILVFEFSRLMTIPDVVIRLQPTVVSVAGSPVSSVPAELFEVQWLGVVLLGMSRIEELPRNVTRPSQVMNALFLHNTSVTTFWSWMDDFVQFSMLFPTKLFNAHGTPYCRELEQISSGTRSVFSAAATVGLAQIMDVSTPEKLAFATKAVDCGPGFPTNFPLPLEDGVHGLH